MNGNPTTVQELIDLLASRFPPDALVHYEDSYWGHDRIVNDVKFTEDGEPVLK